MTSTKKINFGPGPAALPQQVLQQASQAIIDYDNTGLSILEIGHRSKEFNAILEESKQLVKELCNIGDEYEVLWLHGGGRLQFCMVPINFLGTGEQACYIDSGFWAAEAMDYAKHYGEAVALSSSREHNYQQLPAWPAVIPADAAYLHITTNNTIYGTQMKEVPISPVPLIADMSSDIFSCARDYSRCSMFYAVAQKNIGPAGATLVVIRKDMLGNIKREVPPMLSYAAQAKAGSVLNTSPIFAIYTSLLTLRWTKARGIADIEKENEQKASLLYNEIERNTKFFTSVAGQDRSKMNMCFKAVKHEDERKFTDFCAARDMVGIEGHRYAGAFRASLYNAITLQDVAALAAAMQDFEKEDQ